MLGRGGPVGVDRLHVAGVGLALPADQEPLAERAPGVDLTLGDHRQVQATGGLGGVRQHHDRDPAEVLPRLLVGDVVGLPEAEGRREHRDRRLDVDPDVAGVDGEGVGLGRGEPGLVGAVDQQAPDVLERDPPDDLLDVDPAVAQRGALLVGLGDLGLERDHALEPVVDLGHGNPPSRADRAVEPFAFCRAARSSVDAMDLAALRAEYALGGLHESDLAPDPLTMFRAWMSDASASGMHEPNAMVVATVSGDGLPSSRMVLLKGVDEGGFRFFTNLGSRKGAELSANHRCSLLFPWHALERQVRVDGVAEELRPRGRRGVLRDPAAGRPARRLGLAPVQRGALAPGARRGVRRDGGALPRRGAPAGLVGRVRRGPRRRGVLAGTAGPDARPAGVPAYRARLDHVQARALNPLSGIWPPLTVVPHGKGGGPKNEFLLDA